MTDKQDKSVDYEAVLAELAADESPEITVTINGKDIPVTRPPRFAYFKLLMKVQRGQLDDEDMAVQLIKMALPGSKLTDDQVFNIMAKDGFFKGQGDLFKVMEDFGRVLNPNDAFAAGNSKEADENF